MTGIKRPRLFVTGDEATDGVSLYCGAETVEALDGLRNQLEAIVDLMLCDFLSDPKSILIRLDVKPMTDDEVNALPDV